MSLRINDVAPDFTADTTKRPDEDVKKKFPKGLKVLRPYLRLGAQPK